MTVVEETAKWIADLSSNMNNVLAPQYDRSGFEMFSDGSIERHGAYEWVLIRRDEGEAGLNRYVVVAVVPTWGTIREEPDCTVEVWAGADDGFRFGRLLVASRQAVGTLGVLAVAEEFLDQARVRATRLSAADLDGRHIISGRTGDAGAL